jgi:ABC-2 type transport system permease protein
MSTLAVAKKDFKDVRRAKTLWLVIGLLGLVSGLLAYVINGSSGTPDREVVENLFRSIAGINAILLPIVVLIATYLAIAGERETGSIKFLLGLPNSRREIVFGKLLSRLTMVAVAVAVMFLVALVIALVRFAVLPVGVFFGTFVMTLLYGAVFVGIAIAMSSVTASRSRAVAGAVGTYFASILVFFLPGINVRAIVSYLNEDVLGLGTNLDLYQFVQYVSPFFAFQKASNLVVPERLQATLFKSERARDAAAGPGNSAGGQGGESFEAAVESVELPFYLTDEFGFVILLAWFVVPLAIGYWRFERADIG